MKTETQPSMEKLETLFRKYKEVTRRKPADAPAAYPLSAGSGRQTPMSALDELMAMTGLNDVKKAVISQINYHKVMRMRRMAGRKTPDRLIHTLLTGNPGTGKTTVARLIGRIYKEEGILSSGHLIEANRASLVGQWIGESERKTTELLNAARGGVLFIDEMYSLTEQDGDRASTRDYGMKVIDTLMPWLSNPDSDVMIIGAGYTDNMREFIRANPGLASRFPFVMEFPDFSVEELMAIADAELARSDFELSAKARAGAADLLRQAVKVRNFGNARMVMTMINNFMIPNLCNRIVAGGNIADTDISSSSIIIMEDLPDFRTLFPLSDKKNSVGFFQKSATL